MLSICDMCVVVTRKQLFWGVASSQAALLCVTAAAEERQYNGAVWLDPSQLVGPGKCEIVS